MAITHGAPALAWLDIETTGLDPEEHLVLEIGVIVTDADLREIWREHVVRPIDPNTAVGFMDHTVREMHERNGLLDDLREAFEQARSAHGGHSSDYNRFGPLPARQAWLDPVVDGLRRFLSEDGKPLPMAGAGVAHFDRPFLRVEAPGVERCFHYRCVDVSTLRELDRLWGGSLLLPPKRERHRVFDDLKDSISALRVFRENGPHLWAGRR